MSFGLGRNVFLTCTFTLLIIGIVWAIGAVYVLSHPQPLYVDVLDVGQGDSLLITTPSGVRMLIDTGQNQAVLTALGSVLPAHVHELDAVLLTHPDLDHIGGTIPLFDTYTVAHLLYASSSKATDATNAIDALVVPRRALQRGDIVLIDPVHNIRADVLAPDGTWNPNDTNDGSIVLKLTYGATCFLFMGDASVAVEQELVSRYGTELDCDALKVGHHGSDTSTHETFLGYVSPQYAVISAGHDNDFGHPHQSVLDLLSAFNIIVRRTDEHGTVRLRSDGVVVHLE